MPPRKLVIKGFAKPPALPAGYEETTWASLRSAVDAICTERPLPSLSHEELYRRVEGMCLHKFSARLYERLAAELDRHAALKVASLRGRASDSDTAYLERVRSRWQAHCDQTARVRAVFLYLDRSYVLHTPSLPSLWNVSLAAFEKHLVANAGEACDRTVGAALGLVAAERAGQAVARDVLQSAVRMLRMLGLYGPRFEDRLLDEARVFYTADGNTAAGTFDVCAFLTHAEQRLAQANEAVDAYLDAATRRPLVALVEAHLIAPHAEAYLDSGLRSLADDGRVADVRRLHLLLARVALTPKVAAAFGAYAQARATAITTDTDPAHEKGTVAALLDCRRRLDTILCGAFESKEAFAQALKTAFENALNGRGNRPAELLAKHVDAQLRSGAGKDGMDAETSIGIAMKLFSYLHAKDVFEAFYKKDLAKRLLLGKSASLDLEKAVIGKLRAECGGNYTKHLEGMFKDVDLGKELMAQYAASRGAAAGGVNNDTEMVVQVLTQGFWPSYPEMASLIVPPALAAHQAHFNEYYSKKYQGRRIAWQHALGHCIVKARFNGCTKELDVSTYQTLVLVCVGSRGGGGDAPVAFAEIKAATGIEDGELRRTLQSLACAKVKVLRKEPKSRDVNDGDTFAVRVDFKHERIRIKINSIQLRETAEENAKTHANVVRDRECHVDAAVVRIMKARKRLTHNELIAETMKQLRHPATPADLKKRIGTLIEREYVCRDEDEPGVYNYMA